MDEKDLLKQLMDLSQRMQETESHYGKKKTERSWIDLRVNLSKPVSIAYSILARCVNNFLLMAKLVKKIIKCVDSRAVSKQDVLKNIGIKDSKHRALMT